MKIMKTTSLKLFQPATLAALAIITLWGVSIRPAQAGYTVTLQEVGTDVVATGSGAIDLNGLTFSGSSTRSAGLFPTGSGPLHGAFINTGPISSNVDVYFPLTGPRSFGSGGFTYASSGSGDMVEIITSTGYLPGFLGVPMGYVSDTALSGMAVYNGQTFATLGVTPGTHVWTWGRGANQNFTLQIIECQGRCPPTPRPRPTPGSRP